MTTAAFPVFLLGLAAAPTFRRGCGCSTGCRWTADRLQRRLISLPRIFGSYQQSRMLIGKGNRFWIHVQNVYYRACGALIGVFI
jgi:hypothetical protein